MEPDPRENENIHRITGRGIVLMKACMDSVEYNDRGNSVHMVQRSTRSSISTFSKSTIFSKGKDSFLTAYRPNPPSVTLILSNLQTFPYDHPFYCLVLLSVRPEGCKYPTGPIFPTIFTIYSSFFSIAFGC